MKKYLVSQVNEENYKQYASKVLIAESEEEAMRQYLKPEQFPAIQFLAVKELK